MHLTLVISHIAWTSIEVWWVRREDAINKFLCLNVPSRQRGLPNSMHLIEAELFQSGMVQDISPIKNVCRLGHLLQDKPIVKLRKLVPLRADSNCMSRKCCIAGRRADAHVFGNYRC